MKPFAISANYDRPRKQARRTRTLGTLALGSTLLLLPCWRCAAVVPIPDAIIYGTVAIQNRAVTNSPASTNVVIQARRISDGQIMASYAMGSSTSQGPLLYVLRIPMEDAPASSTQLAQPGDLFVITVTKLGTVQFTATNLPPTSGSALRLDFGASVDTDGDGIPDAWELAHVGTLDSDGDGVPDVAEFIAGTNPNDPNEVFHLAIQRLTNGNSQVSFLARLAQGQDYVGLTRYYALESTTNLASHNWVAVPGYDRLAGANQVVGYTSSTTTAAPTFFRGRVWLEGLTPGTDANGDGVPDYLELAWMRSKPSNYQSYIAGTDPNNLANGLRLTFQRATNGMIQVSFPALLAAGAGYEGRTRYYALETATNLLSPRWLTVANYSRIQGTNQVAVYTTSIVGGGSPAFFRARVWLEGP